MTDFKELREALDRRLNASPAPTKAKFMEVYRDAQVIQSWCTENKLRSLLAELDEARKDAERWREWQDAQRLVEEEMPEGYRVILDMSPGDWSLRAEDPAGNALRIEDWESTEHFIRDAVELAKKTAAMKEQQP